MLLMGKSTISTGPFSIAMLVHQRVSNDGLPFGAQQGLNSSPSCCICGGRGTGAGGGGADGAESGSSGGRGPGLKR